jgi:hypothetical protein
MVFSGEHQVRNSRPFGHYNGGAIARSRYDGFIFPKETAS